MGCAIQQIHRMNPTYNTIVGYRHWYVYIYCLSSPVCVVSCGFGEIYCVSKNCTRVLGCGFWQTSCNKSINDWKVPFDLMEDLL